MKRDGAVMLDQFGEDRQRASKVRLGVRQNCVIVVAVRARVAGGGGRGQKIKQASFPHKRESRLIFSRELQKPNQDGFPLARE
ncbi:MAG TPA: hypothetical protein VLC97_13770 [Rhodanobacteraceae bacterium]|jgi:hypothetical protein|nr:hypothetical protein [Rhodanobacteraceae bacterium]